MKQIMLNYAFRIMKLVIIIFSISYFIGTLWYIFVWQINETNGFFVTYGLNLMMEENKDLDRYFPPLITS